MILVCPACNARYLVPATNFAAGPRQVRCARCTHTWQAQLSEEPAATLTVQLVDLTSPPVVTAPIPAGSNLPVIHEDPKRKWIRRGIMGAYAAIALLVILLFVFDRQNIAKHRPSLENLYDKIGLHIYHAGEGLSLQQVRSEQQFEDGGLHLTVQGQIRNDTPKTQAIPDIIAVATGPDGKPMQSWQIDAPAATLAPAETVPFQSSIRSPQGTVVEINLSFIEPKNAD